MVLPLVFLLLVIGVAVFLLFSPLRTTKHPSVTVMVTGSPALIALAKSILDDAGIPYFPKGEGVQELFGVGRVGGTYNFVTGPVEIQVPSNYEKQARVLLADLETSYNVEELREEGEPEGSSETLKK